MVKPMLLTELDDDLPHPPVPDIAAMKREIEEGKTDARAGRTVDGQTVLRRIRAKVDELRSRLHGETLQKG